jgi:hypothetical protein
MVNDKPLPPPQHRPIGSDADLPPGQVTFQPPPLVLQPPASHVTMEARCLSAARGSAASVAMRAEAGTFAVTADSGVPIGNVTVILATSQSSDVRLARLPALRSLQCLVQTFP